MILIKTIAALELLLKKIRKQGQSIGFVPTMGALHDGHLSLVKTARIENDCCICSIFVNPTQFNNPKDFKLYPISLETDIGKLFGAGADIVFIPAVDEMYPAQEKIIRYKLGYLEEILEGKFRPGHYQGVSRVMDKFLRIIQPDVLYLGQKDYQQCMVVQKLIELKKFHTQLKICPTVREKSGLAMSSRNRRLNPKQAQLAEKISEALRKLKKELKPGPAQQIVSNARLFLEQQGFSVDYVSMVSLQDFKEIEHWDGKTPVIALIAAFIDDIRLIDNLILHDFV